jgi:hypothetical protein
MKTPTIKPDSIFKRQATVIRLPKDTSKRITQFWVKHGKLGFAMISQPVYKGSGYTLKIRMLSDTQADSLQEAFDNILSKP